MKLLVLLALLLAGCAAPIAAPRTVAPTVEGLMLSHGSGTGQGATFSLAGASQYFAVWSVTTSDPRGCYVHLRMDQVGGTYYGVIVDTVAMPRAEPAVGYLHDVPPGSYYISAVAECPWSVGLSRT